MAIRGLILAGGTGSRLWPATAAVNKHLLPVHDKPMIYYALSNLMLTGAKTIGIVSSPDQLPLFKKLIGDGSKFGIRVEYFSQTNPGGIVDALKSATSFMKIGTTVVQLGDNFFFGAGLLSLIRKSVEENTGASVFTYRVADAKPYGILEVNDGRVVSIEEKPRHPRSNLAITGLYVFDGSALDRAQHIKPSGRGELEITDLLRSYLFTEQLSHSILPRGSAWLDLGTLEDLSRATTFVETLQSRQGLLVGSPEEVAFRHGLLSHEQIQLGLGTLNPGSYSETLFRTLQQ